MDDEQAIGKHVTFRQFDMGRTVASVTAHACHNVEDDEQVLLRSHYVNSTYTHNFVSVGVNFTGPTENTEVALYLTPEQASDLCAMLEASLVEHWKATHPVYLLDMDDDWRDAHVIP